MDKGEQPCRIRFLFISLALGAIVFAICAVGILITSNQDGAGDPSLLKYLVFGAPGYFVFGFLVFYSFTRGRMPWTTESD